MTLRTIRLKINDAQYRTLLTAVNGYGNWCMNNEEFYLQQQTLPDGRDPAHGARLAHESATRAFELQDIIKSKWENQHQESLGNNE